MAAREQAFKPSVADAAVKAATGRDWAGWFAAHQKADGQFSVTVSKTMQADVSTLYEAVASAPARRKWFPPGTLKISSQTRGKYLRAAWKDGTRLEFGFASKDGGKAQLAVAVNKLGGQGAVETERALWKKAFNQLATALED